MGILLNRTVNQAVVLANSANNANDLGEELKYAALNTLVGLAVVFLVLTLIIFIISLFKFIPYLQERFSTKTSSSEAIDNALAQIVQQEEAEEELVDDYELVAVITAAIQAYMGSKAPADGLVVRSIRRAGRRNR